MRVEMLNLYAIYFRESAECAKLIQDEVVKFLIAHCHVAAPEALQIRIARMGSDSNAPFSSFSYCFVHNHGVPRMHTAGEIG